MKILIIDDIDISRKYLKEFIERFAGNDYDFKEACNYDSARLFLDDKFDIVLCDHKLGNDKFGLDIIGDYIGLWPDAKCFLYSADSEILNKTLAKKIKCYSMPELEGELELVLNNYNNNPKEDMTMQTGFNQVLCDMNHKQNEKDHDRIEARQDTIVSDMKGIAEHFQKSMDKVVEKIEDSNKKLDNSNTQGRNMFWGMIVFGGGVMGTCLTMAYKVFFGQ